MEQQQTSRKAKQERNRPGVPGLIEDTVASTIDDVKAIVDAKLELFRIEMTEKVALASAMVLLAVVLMIGASYLLNSGALLIGELLGHFWLGYLIVSLVFLGCFAFFTKVKPEALKNFIHKILLSAND
ncbi:MAG TPA: phage holin family protein [Chlorobaculum parvum]|uniref:Phage holin family protein n=1 Tax=Chlorobaculum parvum TaxID=274539 RepID=A0A7C5DLF6_9CHLB|nr:phage holin family protein [Chlorobaculum parvum]